MSSPDLLQATAQSLVQAISGIQNLLGGSGAGTFVLGTATSYPNTAIPVIKSSGTVSAATASAALAASTSRTNYITGFDITSSGATSPTVVVVSVTGLLGGTINYIYATVAGASVLNTPLSVRFPIALPGSAINTVITVSLPSLGAGNTNACVTVYGYSL